MTTLFQPIINEEGEITGYEPVDVNDIPEEIVREHPLHKQVVDESVKRRQKAKELKDQLAKLESGDSVDDDNDDTPAPPAPPKQKTEPVVQPVDKDELYSEFKTRLLREQQEEQEQISSYQQMVNRIAKENNVSPALLRGRTEAELTEHAQLISKEYLKFKDIGASPDGTVEIGEDLWKRIDAKFGWDE